MAFVSNCVCLHQVSPYISKVNPAHAISDLQAPSLRADLRGRVAPEGEGLYTVQHPEWEGYVIYFPLLCGCQVTNDVTTQHGVKRVNEYVQMAAACICLLSFCLQNSCTKVDCSVQMVKIEGGKS